MLVVSGVALACLSRAQAPAGAQREAPSPDPATRPQAPAQQQYKRILGIIPNYRSTSTLANYRPLTPSQKFKLAVQDSFDPGTVILAAFIAGEHQLTNDAPSYGQGVAGYARYLGAAYGDLVIGNFMTEAIYPTLLHQDPRYFRRGTGSGLSRLGYAMSQVFRTHGDSGRTEFNFSEIAGNATAVAISNAYYPGHRSAQDAAEGLGVQLGLDMAGNILKEFWPDLAQKFESKHRASAAPGAH